MPKSKDKILFDLKEKYDLLWHDALKIWSEYVRLTPADYYFDSKSAKAAGLSQSFAAIRLKESRVMIDLEKVVKHGLEDFILEILSHEIGHHVAFPGNMLDFGQMTALIQAAVKGNVPNHISLIGNLYTDLLINDRLQRQNNLRMSDIYIRLGKSKSPLWNVYMRIYELLWSLPTGTLTENVDSSKSVETQEADAILGSRLIRNYAGSDWVRGAGKFAMLLVPYILADQESDGQSQIAILSDLENAAQGEGFPGGFASVGISDEDIVHPSMDPELNPTISNNKNKKDGLEKINQSIASGGGNTRSPSELNSILNAMGVKISDDDLYASYYRELSLPHLIPYPVKKRPSSTEPLPEGLDVWDSGTALDRVSWIESASRSPYLIPGYTLLERTYGEQPGPEPEFSAPNLDLYIDCSGSMPNPRYQVSYLALAGAIISLSALRAGARVQAVLWSGPNQVLMTDEFTREEKKIFKVLTGFFGGGTAFPLTVLEETYIEPRNPRQRKIAEPGGTHVLLISDDGIDTMFLNSPSGFSGWDISEAVLSQAGAGTMVLNLYSEIDNYPVLVRAKQQGWNIFRVNDLASLVKFARDFARLTYAEDQIQSRKKNAK
ncbi:MAG: VWA domain-containing protein [Leptospiraceae bacterium]|nr:VWA domain-containing protein [Leptospiraceae bacterium]